LSRGFVNPGAFTTLVVARIIYAANFYNIAAVFTLIAADFNDNVAGLGLLSSGFLLGIGAFQIPGGVFAANEGPRKAAAFGTLLASSAVTVSALAPALGYLVLLRFVVGVGMAFVFGPGIALTAKYFKKGQESLAVGIYNSTFSLGSVIGLSAWAVLAVAVGWRPAILAGGIGGVVTGLMLLYYIPSDPDPAGFRMSRSELKSILLDRRLLLMGFGVLGMNTALNIVNTFIVYYLEVNLALAPLSAGLVASLTWASGFLVSLFTGRSYDRAKHPRALFLAAATSSSVGVAMISYPNPAASVAGAVLVGGAVGIGSTVAFSIARDVAKDHPRLESLAIAWVNTIHYFGSFWSTLLFSYLALSLGYESAWVVVGAVLFPFVLPLMLVRASQTRPSSQV